VKSEFAELGDPQLRLLAIGERCFGDATFVTNVFFELEFTFLPKFRWKK